MWAFLRKRPLDEDLDAELASHIAMATDDNIRAGILTLRILRSWTRYDDNAIAAYYQGLGAVRRHGHFKDTKRYVASVRAHERNLKRTGSPF